MSPILRPILETYGAVFVAEIVGDKLLYTTGVLATRYLPLPIILGMLVAFMAKMAVAVAVGDAIAHLPRLLVAGLTAASFIGIGIMLWRKPVERSAEDVDKRFTRAAMMSFATIFFSEWGDAGQLAAATKAAQFPTLALYVWTGAVAAMATKGALAASIGARVRQWIVQRISPRTVRVAGVCALAILGVLSVMETLNILPD